MMGGVNMAELLNNPMVQQMTQQMMQNPQLMADLMRNNPLMGGAGAVPVAAFPLAGMPPPVLDPAAAMRYAQVHADPNVQAAVNALRAAVVNAPLPAAPAAAENPYAALFAGLGATGGQPARAAPATGAQPSRAALQARYQAELAQLVDMGFTDADANLQALLDTGGNVQAALERLLR